MAKNKAQQSLDKINRNMNREIKKMAKRTMRGFIRAEIVIKRDVELTPPKTPVGKTGNLRGSWFDAPFFVGDTPFLIFGYGAEYAIWVHEMIGATFKRPGAGAKWFEAALKRNRKEMLLKIREEAEIG